MNLSKAERIIVIRNSMVKPIRFNVDISFTEDDIPDLKDSKGWGENKTEYFNGLTALEVEVLNLLLAVHNIGGTVRIHQIV